VPRECGVHPGGEMMKISNILAIWVGWCSASIISGFLGWFDSISWEMRLYAIWSGSGFLMLAYILYRIFGRTP